jgi:hypothetical protein
MKNKEFFTKWMKNYTVIKIMKFEIDQWIKNGD